MPSCPICQTNYNTGVLFCRLDGAKLGPAAIPNIERVTRFNFTRRISDRKLIAIVTCTFFIILTGLVAYMWTRPEKLPYNARQSAGNPAQPAINGGNGDNGDSGSDGEELVQRIDQLPSIAAPAAGPETAEAAPALPAPVINPVNHNVAPESRPAEASRVINDKDFAQADFHEAAASAEKANKPAVLPLPNAGGNGAKIEVNSVTAPSIANVPLVSEPMRAAAPAEPKGDPNGEPKGDPSTASIMISVTEKTRFKNDKEAIYEFGIVLQEQKGMKIRWQSILGRKITNSGKSYPVYTAIEMQKAGTVSRYYLTVRLNGEDEAENQGRIIFTVTGVDEFNRPVECTHTLLLDDSFPLRSKPGFGIRSLLAKIYTRLLPL